MISTFNHALTMLQIIIFSVCFSLGGLAVQAQEVDSPVNVKESSSEKKAVSLMEAYKKEYAFLEAQKNELQKRLEEFQARAETNRKKVKLELDELSDQVFALDKKGRDLQKEIEKSEQAILARQDNADLLMATLNQGAATLKEHGRKPKEERFQEMANEEKVAWLFLEADRLVRDLSGIRKTEGKFYLTDGSQVEGEIVKIGDIAAFGLSAKDSGALAPAGDGEYRIWPQSTGKYARAVAQGEETPELKLFLYESLQKAVTVEVDEDVADYVAGGGVIAWVIVVLGVLAALLVVVRAMLLKMAGTSTRFIRQRIAGLVREGRIEEALKACRKRNGSAARVVAAALRHLDEDREHLEDVITENIMNESVRLEKFGAFILVIAGVAPLLGLLGTVTGMISTFDVITEFGTGDPKMLSGGISTALVTTQLGLVVAIPTLLCGTLLTAWGDRIKDDMEKAALHITTIEHSGRD